MLTAMKIHETYPIHAREMVAEGDEHHPVPRKTGSSRCENDPVNGTLIDTLSILEI